MGITCLTIGIILVFASKRLKQDFAEVMQEQQREMVRLNQKEASDDTNYNSNDNLLRDRLEHPVVD